MVVLTTVSSAGGGMDVAGIAAFCAVVIISLFSVSVGGFKILSNLSFNSSANISGFPANIVVL